GASGPDRRRGRAHGGGPCDRHAPGSGDLEVVLRHRPVRVPGPGPARGVRAAPRISRHARAVPTGPRLVGIPAGHRRAARAHDPDRVRRRREPVLRVPRGVGRVTPPRLALTVGDPAGIGPEVVLRALADPARPDVPVVVYGPMASLLDR